MAFTRTPTVSTEQTKTVPLMHEWNARNTSLLKDVDNVNCVFELVSNKLTDDNYYEVLKRDGLLVFTLTPAPASPILGAYYWTDFQKYVVVGLFGFIMYNIDGTQFQPPATGTVWNGGPIGFTPYLYEDGTEVLVVSDGQHMSIFSSTGVETKITDPDLPIPHLSQPVFLDGYLFVAANGGNIYNSDLNNPTSWSAGNVIAAESYPDPITALQRLGQYIVAFGRLSIQFFYDAANPTGTPLAPQTTVLNIGYLQNSLARYEESIVFIGEAQPGVRSIYQLKGLRAEAIDNGTSARYFSELDSVLGFTMVINGHSHYVVYPNRMIGAVPGGVYALDLDTKLWSRLLFQSTNDFPAATAVTGLFGNLRQWRTAVTFFNSAVPYIFSAVTFQDGGVNYTTSFVTPNMDFGTYRKKFGSRIMVHGDQPTDLSGVPAVTSNAFISWSDNDYQTYSTPRAVNMASQYKQVFRLGAFRKRAFKFTYSDNYPMRWQFLELDYSQGSS